MSSSPDSRFQRLILDPVVRLSKTRANAHAGLVSDASISAILLGAGALRGDCSWETKLALALAGVIIFSFIEYCFHRWVFHGAPSALERGHTEHHERPLGHDSLPFFLPPVGMLLVAGLFALCMPLTAALTLGGGVAAGYAAYGLGHVIIHSVRFRSSLARRWAAAHHIHHRHPGKNFGVTSPLWDFLLGSRYVSKARLRTGNASAP